MSSDADKTRPAARKTRTIRFRRIDVRTRDPHAAEMASAATVEAGAAGLEELQDVATGGTVQRFRIYVDAEHAPGVRAALDALRSQGVSVESDEEEPETDWSRAWREGLMPIEISPRLVIAPSFLASTPRQGQRVVTIDPGQAFGTGGHASTRLALELITAQPVDALLHATVLDVGTGSGVLAIASLAMGARRAIGFDIDPLAARAARMNGENNGFMRRLRLFTGGMDAIKPDATFGFVVANLLRTELLPIADQLVARTAPDGVLAVSGLLESELPEVRGRFERDGFGVIDERAETDSTDTWVALALKR